MNLTIDQYVEGLEHCAKELPSIMNDWDKIDYDLKEEYAEQLQWQLGYRIKAMTFNTDFTKIISLSKRIEAAVKEIYTHRTFIENNMGLDVDFIELKILNEQIEFLNNENDTEINSGVYAEIKTLEHKAADLINKRASKTLDKLEADLEKAVSAAKRLLGKG